MRPKKDPKKTKSVFREYLEAFLIAIILALLIRQFVVQAFKIPSGSMMPTLKIGDHILVNKFIYRFDDPKRGDVVVFKFPKEEKRDFIKRIVGIPGDEILIKDKTVYINGMPLKEDYVMFNDPNILPAEFSARDNFGPAVAPPNHYFLMGDNRDNSMDSRFWGFLDRKKMKGKAFVIYWSWNSEKHWPRWKRMGKLIH